MTHRTKDELYILAAYAEALQSGDMRHVMDRYVIGKKIGMAERGVDAIFKELMRTNFLKKVNEIKFTITPHGEALAKRLLED